MCEKSPLFKFSKQTNQKENLLGACLKVIDGEWRHLFLDLS